MMGVEVLLADYLELNEFERDGDMGSTVRGRGTCQTVSAEDKGKCCRLDAFSSQVPSMPFAETCNARLATTSARMEFFDLTPGSVTTTMISVSEEVTS